MSEAGRIETQRRNTSLCATDHQHPMMCMSTAGMVARHTEIVIALILHIFLDRVSGPCLLDHLTLPAAIVYTENHGGTFC